MKRNTLLGLVILSLLAPGLHRLVNGPQPDDQSAPTRRQLVSEIMRGVNAPTHPSLQTQVLATGETEPGFNHQARTIKQIAQPTAAIDLPALCDSLMRDSNGDLAELQRVLRGWAETNGPAAAAWAFQLLPDPTSHELLTQVALGWSATDLAGALDWAHTLPAGATRESVFEQLGYATARTDAVKALELAAALEAAPQRDDLIEHALSQWAIVDFTAAVQWADGNVSDPDLRQRLFATVAVAAAGQAGSAAATLAATALDPGAEQDRVAVAVVQRWVQNEPELAASWVAQFPDTPARETTVQNLVAFWTTQDRQAAANWLQALPEGTLRDAGMAAYSQTLAMTGIASAE
jgi:hypothetical protein